MRTRRSAAAGGGGAAGARAGSGAAFSKRRSAKWRRTSWLMRTAASLVGRQIGSYQILSLLGAGGMGEVYRARDTKLGRDVAIKVVADALPFRPGAARALRTRGAGAGDAEPSAHRRDLWSGGGRRRPRPRARARRRRDARRASGVGSVADSGGAHGRAPDRGRARSRAREGHHPPRSETGEHQDHARRHREGARLRAGEGVRDGGIGTASCRSADDRRVDRQHAKE